MIEFNAKDYWEKRIERDYNLNGVGCLNYGRYWNYWLYKVRKRGFIKHINDLDLDFEKIKVLDIGSELGIFGFLAFSLFVYRGFFIAFKTLKYAEGNSYFASLTLLLLVIFMLIYACVDGDLNECRLFFTWISSVYAYNRLISRNNLIITSILHNKR